MSAQNPLVCSRGESSSLCIALVGVSDPESSFLHQRLALALPDTAAVRFGSLAAVLAALQASSDIAVVVVGSALPDDERQTAGAQVRSARPSVAVLDVEDWQGPARPSVPGHTAENLVAVAVRAALLREVAPDDVASLSASDVALALRGQQLELHYQPVVDLARCEVVGVEALVRWRHPELGLLPAELFVPLAESTQLGAELGRWVLSAACRQAASWHRQGLRLELSVNLSARHMVDPALADDISRALAQSGLEPGHLVLEVTESALMQDVDAAPDALARIRTTGAGIAIDDFGTGYSSLLYLKRYRLSALKLDASFIAGLGVDADDDAIVGSVVALATAVGAVCVAEGVETADQHLRLLALGCARAQGFLFSPPVPPPQVPAAVDAAEAWMVRAADQTPVPSHRAPELAVANDVVAHMVRLHESGASYPTIAAALNQMGSLHPKGTRWHRTSVARYLADLGAVRQSTR